MMHGQPNIKMFVTVWDLKMH